MNRANVDDGSSHQQEHHHRTTIQELEWLAEQEYGGGRGRVDSRELYEYTYFEDLEPFLYQALRTKYPEMTPTDIVVCVSTWIYDNSVNRASYGAVTDRLLSGVGSVPRSVLGSSDDLLPTDKSRKEAVDQAYNRGYVTAYSFDMHGGKTAGPFLGLREDIDDYLDEVVFRECAASDAALIAAGHGDRIAELNEKFKQNQVHFEEQAVKFYFRENEKGESVPLTEQEQKDRIGSVASGRNNDDTRQCA